MLRGIFQMRQFLGFSRDSATLSFIMLPPDVARICKLGEGALSLCFSLAR